LPGWLCRFDIFNFFAHGPCIEEFQPPVKPDSFKQRRSPVFNGFGISDEAEHMVSEWVSNGCPNKYGTLI
jgi:hypothetical protein